MNQFRNSLKSAPDPSSGHSFSHCIQIFLTSAPLQFNQHVEFSPSANPEITDTYFHGYFQDQQAFVMHVRSRFLSLLSRKKNLGPWSDQGC
ncbi:hypothetical protein B0H19DRAFT_1115607 [Mycena capillaripes]|nr:hypothetical protein B0H19DRAFT_1115607 [Mycena capillaripes]